MSFFRRKKLPSAIKPSVTFGRLLIKRVDSDGLTMLAGHLAYVSLLSLVPLLLSLLAWVSAYAAVCHSEPASSRENRAVFECVFIISP